MRIKNQLIGLGIWLGVGIVALGACGVEHAEHGHAGHGAAKITVQEIVNRVEVDGLNPKTEEPEFVDLQLGQLTRHDEKSGAPKGLSFGAWLPT